MPRWNEHAKRMDLSTAKLYYISLIRPQLEYAAAVLFNMSATNMKMFETLQNKCMRIVAVAVDRTKSKVLRKQLNIPTLARSINFYVNFTTYRIILFLALRIKLTYVKF